MIKNVLEYLEASEAGFPDKTAYTDKNGEITFGDLGNRARRLGSFLARKTVKGKPVAVFMEKSVDMILGFMGTVYAGGFYCPIDVTMPEEYMGDVIGDINSRRGKIEGMDDVGGGRVVHGFVPLSEMFGYSTDLRSRTQGRGSYSMFFDHYERVPQSVQDKVLDHKDF